MTIKIGHASIDEHGKATGGQIGDQTGKEVKISSWYQHPWNVYLEYPDKIIAEKAASIMERICKNDKIGYDQSQRTTMYESIAKNIKLGMTLEKAIDMAEGETDCSDCVSVCYKLAGFSNLSIDNTTSSLKKALTSLGFKAYTDSDHIDTDKYATRGGIFLSEGHHVVMALENGSAIPTNPFKMSKDDFVKYVTNKKAYPTASDVDKKKLASENDALRKKYGVKEDKYTYDQLVKYL